MVANQQSSALSEPAPERRIETKLPLAVARTFIEEQLNRRNEHEHGS